MGFSEANRTITVASGAYLRLFIECDYPNLGHPRLAWSDDTYQYLGWTTSANGGFPRAYENYMFYFSMPAFPAEFPLTLYSPNDPSISETITVTVVDRE